MGNLSNELKHEIFISAFPDASGKEVDSSIFDSLYQYVDVYYEGEDDETYRYVTIYKNGESISRATSNKINNIRFRLREAALELGTDAILTTNKIFETSSGEPWLVVFLCLKFLIGIQKITSVDIKPSDAQILLDLLKVKNDNVKIQHDEFLRLMFSKYPEINIEESLSRLEQIGSIERMDDQIFIHEDITIISV
jgi:hypothetical protein